MSMQANMIRSDFFLQKKTVPRNYRLCNLKFNGKVIVDKVLLHTLSLFHNIWRKNGYSSPEQKNYKH